MSLLHGRAESSCAQNASDRYCPIFSCFDDQYELHLLTSMCPRLILTRCLQPCTFKVDYTLENVPGREFGSVFLTEKNENLALIVVSSGWSKVGEHPTSQDVLWLLML